MPAGQSRQGLITLWLIALRVMVHMPGLCRQQCSGAVLDDPAGS